MHLPFRFRCSGIRGHLTLTLAVVFASLLIAGLQPVRAQEATAPAEPTPAATDPAPAKPASPPAAPQTIRAVDVAQASEALSAELRRTVPAEEPAFLEHIRIELYELSYSIDLLEGRIAAIHGRSVDSHRLLSVAETIRSTNEQIKDWRKKLTPYAGVLDASDTALTQSHDLWNRTLESLTSAETPPALLEQVRTTLAEIGQAREKLRQRHETVLALEGDISAQARRLLDAQDAIEAMQDRARAGLLHRDTPPIWRMFEAPESTGRMAREVAQFVEESLGTTQAYAAKHVAHLVMLALAWLTILVFLVSIRRRHAERLGSDPRLETTVALIHRPVSTAFLIALLLVPLFLPDRPESIRRLVGLAAVLPLLRLIPAVTPAGLRRIAYGTVMVFLAARFTYAFPEGSGLARLFHAILAAFIGIGTWRSMAGEQAQSKRPTVLNIARVLAGVLAVAALLANTAGLSVLSALLVQGIAQSAFVGVGLQAIALTTLGCFRLLALLGPLRHLRSFQLNYTMIEKQADRVIHVVAVLIWIVATLAAFSVYDLALAAIGAFLAHGWTIGAISISVGDVVAFAVAIWVSVLVSRVLRFFLGHDVLPRVDLPRGVPETTLMMVQYALAAIGVLAACAVAGVNLSQFSIIVGALGVGIGFGLQNLVNNFVSGLILIFERPINVGDTVQFGTTSGVVRRIGIRASVVRTFDGAEIIVPNGNLISNDLTNWTLSDRNRRIDLVVGVAYGSDPERVIKILTETAARCEGVQRFPEPWTSFDGFGASSLNFTLRCWTPDLDQWVKVKSDVGIAVGRALAEAGITIPFPQHDLHLRSIDPQATEQLRQGRDAAPRA